MVLTEFPPNPAQGVEGICRYFPTLNYFNPVEYISTKADPESDIEEEAPEKKASGGGGGSPPGPGGSMELRETVDLASNSIDSLSVDDVSGDLIEFDNPVVTA